MSLSGVEAMRDEYPECGAGVSPSAALAAGCQRCRTASRRASTRERERQTDRQTYGQTDRQADRQMSTC
eukprot:2867161-Rhodomonas_salina.1